MFLFHKKLLITFPILQKLFRFWITNQYIVFAFLWHLREHFSGLCLKSRAAYRARIIGRGIAHDS